VFYTRARAYAAKKDYQRAIHDYTDVINRGAGNVAAYAGRATAATAVNLDAAIADYPCDRNRPQ
jgi:hypothetical protein